LANKAKREEDTDAQVEAAIAKKAADVKIVVDRAAVNSHKVRQQNEAGRQIKIDARTNAEDFEIGVTENKRSKIA
jgi:hypothetical protein